MSFRLLSLLLFVAVSGCNGPFMLLPGGELDGEVKPSPSDWSFIEGYGMAELETRPEDPYSVNLAVTVIEGTLYINAGDTETEWVKNIAEDPLVRLRWDDVLYESRAERVTSATTVAKFGEVWAGQSMFMRDPSELDEVWLYRLVPR